ncbi:MAG: CvpA family protein [Treponema sp.]|nr:CvpA family protein [Treponema sp.]
MNLGVMDIFFILLIALFMIRGYLKGFISEVLSMAAIVLGVLGAVFFYKNGGEYVRTQFLPESQIIPEIIAFITILLIVFVIGKLLEILLKQVIRGVKLGGADRILGIVFGFAEGIAVVSLVLFLLRVQPIVDLSGILDNSIFGRLLLPLIIGTAETGSVDLKTAEESVINLINE